MTYSADGSNFAVYQEHGVKRVFPANWDASTTVQHTHHPVWAKSVRIYTENWDAVVPYLRLELYGYTEAEPADLSGDRHPGFLGPLFLRG